MSGGGSRGDSERLYALRRDDVWDKFVLRRGGAGAEMARERGDIIPGVEEEGAAN